MVINECEKFFQDFVQINKKIIFLFIFLKLKRYIESLVEEVI